MVDTGPTEFRGEATVLRIDGPNWEIVRPGVVPGVVRDPKIAPAEIVRGGK